MAFNRPGRGADRHAVGQHGNAGRDVEPVVEAYANAEGEPIGS